MLHILSFIPIQGFFEFDEGAATEGRPYSYVHNQR